LRAAANDFKRSYSRILKRGGGGDEGAAKRAPFSRILRSDEEPSAHELEEWLAAAQHDGGDEDVEGELDDGYYDPYLFSVHARAPGYSRIL